MICDNCKKDRLEKDFINNQEFCYHCTYLIKLKKQPKKGTKNPYCRTCGKKFEQNQNMKKRQRTIFCSLECAEAGHKYQLRNHWTRKITVEPAVRRA